jgi:phage tail-like protein
VATVANGRLREHLPAIYREGGDDTLGRLLSVFEDVLLGSGDPDAPGIEEILDGVPDGTGRHVGGSRRYFDPGPYPVPGPEGVSPSIAGRTAADQAPLEFLEWLAEWVALSQWAGLSELSQRDFIARAVPIYRMRGTVEGLRELIRIHTRLAPDIRELDSPFQIGVRSTVGQDTVIAGNVPFLFRVRINLAATAPSPAEIAHHTRVVRAIVDAEKPAHTHYITSVRTPTLRIGVHSRVGADTLLGSPMSG